MSEKKKITEEAIKYGRKKRMKLAPPLKIGTISVWSAIFAVKKITAIKLMSGKSMLR